MRDRGRELRLGKGRKKIKEKIKRGRKALSVRGKESVDWERKKEERGKDGRKRRDGLSR